MKTNYITPKMYNDVNFTVNDTNNLLDKDFSVSIEKGNYMIVPMDLVSSDVYAKLENLDTILYSYSSVLKVGTINGERVYLVYQQYTIADTTIIMKEQTYNELNDEGYFDEDKVYFPHKPEDLKLTLNKSTRLALDPDVHNEIWEDEEEGQPAFHLKDLDAYKFEQNHEFPENGGENPVSGILNKRCVEKILKLND